MTAEFDHCLNSGERSRLRSIVAALGQRGAAEALSITRATLTRALDGLPLRPSTLECVLRRIDEFDSLPVTADEHHVLSGKTS